MPDQHAPHHGGGTRASSQGLVTRVRGDRLTLTLRRDDQDALVDAFGELDLASVAILGRAVADLGRVRTVVLDASQLSFVDAAGLRGLLALREEGTIVVLRRPSPLLRRILEITDTAANFCFEGT